MSPASSSLILKRLAIIEMAEGAVKWKGPKFTFKMKKKGQISARHSVVRKKEEINTFSALPWPSPASPLGKRTAAMPFDGMP